MKKRICAFAVVVICLSILASTTIAYFTDTATARNVITSGGVDIAIEEWQRTDGGLVPYPKDTTIHIMPSVTVSKIVTVRNYDAESFIRAKLTVTVLAADGEEMELTDAQRKAAIHLALNSEDWIEKDDWWYYKVAVDTGDVTEPLLTAVSFDGPNMTNEYQNCTIEIDVNAQAVQCANNNDYVLDALGWPESE